MKYSEIKKRIKCSLSYEALIKSINFIKQHKYFVTAFIVSVLVISSLLAPLINKISNSDGSNEYTANTIKNEPFEEQVTVYVAGQVKNPGLYTLTNTKRVSDAIEKAGGVKEDADISKINLAQKLSDEQYINVPSVNDASNYSTGNKKSFEGVLNINTASAVQLQQLSGIGPALSQRIIEYRTTNGQFKDIKDIMKVKGIGYSLFNKIKDNITV